MFVKRIFKLVGFNKYFFCSQIRRELQESLILSKASLFRKQPSHLYSSATTKEATCSRLELYGFLLVSGSAFLGSSAYTVYLEKTEKKLRFNQLSELKLIKEFEEQKRYSEEPQVTGYIKLSNYFSSKVAKEFAKSSSLTQCTYRESHRIPFAPTVYYHKELKQSVEVCFVGNQLSDDDGNIHEGVLSTYIDESVARVAFLQFLTPHMFTANLSINFQEKLPENSFFKIITKLSSKVEQKPYKATIESKVLDLSGKLIATATSVFLVPKSYRSTIGMISPE